MNNRILSLLICTIVLATLVSCQRSEDNKSPGTVTGFWIGIGNFTNNCQNPQCSWRVSYGLDLVQSGSDVTGYMDFTLIADEGNSTGSGCESFLINGNISNGTVTENNFSFDDTDGNRWEVVFSEDRMSGRAGNAVEDCAKIKSDDVSIVREEKGEIGGAITPMTWRNVDECDDTQKVNYRFFDCSENNCYRQVWPELPDMYQATELEKTYLNVIQCPRRAKVCVGAQTEDGSKVWGVGIDATQDCLDCCNFCEESEIAFFPFQCQNAKQ